MNSRALCSLRRADRMNGRGRCMDNIFTERLWRTVKYEHVYLSRIKPSMMQALVSTYFDFYNNKRIPHP